MDTIISTQLVPTPLSIKWLFLRLLRLISAYPLFFIDTKLLELICKKSPWVSVITDLISVGNVKPWPAVLFAVALLSVVIVCVAGLFKTLFDQTDKMCIQFWAMLAALIVLIGSQLIYVDSLGQLLELVQFDNFAIVLQFDLVEGIAYILGVVTFLAVAIISPFVAIYGYKGVLDRLVAIPATSNRCNSIAESHFEE